MSKKEKRELARFLNLLYNETNEGYAGVAELADAVDLKSKIALLEKLLRELKRKIQ